MMESRSPTLSTYSSGLGAPDRAPGVLSMASDVHPAEGGCGAVVMAAWRQCGERAWPLAGVRLVASKRGGGMRVSACGEGGEALSVCLAAAAAAHGAARQRERVRRASDDAAAGPTGK